MSRVFRIALRLGPSLILGGSLAACGDLEAAGCGAQKRLANQVDAQTQAGQSGGPPSGVSAGGGQSTGLPSSPGAEAYDHIEAMSGWHAVSGPVSTCLPSDQGCNAPTARYHPFEIQSGQSILEVDQGPPYADTLYSKYLGTGSQGDLQEKTDVILDADFQVDTDKIQNLEFDLTHSLNRALYMAGSQCNYARGVWQGWAEGGPNPGWRDTGAPCARFGPGAWHHLSMSVHFDHVAGTYSYETIQIDGQNYKANLDAMPARAGAGWADGTGVQVQLDQDSSGAAIREFVRNVKLTAM